MKKGDLLFVYGTLRRGASADLSNNVLADFVGEDKINGELFNLGWFPGLKTTPGHFDPGAPSVQGDVFRIREESIIAQLDAYEGYPDLYNRIETETGHGRHVWVYTYNHEVVEEQRILNGDWLNYVEATKPRPSTAA